jgi:hypothetical protein
MVKEIVPFSKKHITVVMVTIQNFNISLCSWVFIFVNFKFSCAWNFFIYFNRIKIEIISILNKDFSSIRNLFSYFLVRYLIFLNKLLGRHYILIKNLRLFNEIILVSFSQHISYLLVFHFLKLLILCFKITFILIIFQFKILFINEINLPFSFDSNQLLSLFIVFFSF